MISFPMGSNARGARSSLRDVSTQTFLGLNPSKPSPGFWNRFELLEPLWNARTAAIPELHTNWWKTNPKKKFFGGKPGLCAQQCGKEGAASQTWRGGSSPGKRSWDSVEITQPHPQVIKQLNSSPADPRAGNKSGKFSLPLFLCWGCS